MKIEIKKKKSASFTKVELAEPTVGDLVNAERIAGKIDSLDGVLALLATIGTFDSKKLTIEELKGISTKDFFELSNALKDTGMGELAEQLSSSLEKDDLATEMS